MHPHTSYLIYATPRSGSFLLCEALIGTRLAGKPTDYFNPWQTWRLLQGCHATNYATCLASILQVGSSPNGVFGGKIMWPFFEDLVGHLRGISGYEKLPLPELMATAFPNLHYIWVTRREKVRQAISYYKALRTDYWAPPEAWQPFYQVVSSLGGRCIEATAEEQNRQSNIKEPTFDFDAIDYTLKCIEKDELGMQQYFAACGFQPFKVVYEDFVQAYEETALQILDYLHIPIPKDLVFAEKKMKKQANEQSEEWVKLYHQLKFQQEAKQQIAGQI
jgi:LPS sulfotransferase NodH